MPMTPELFDYRLRALEEDRKELRAIGLACEQIGNTVKNLSERVIENEGELDAQSERISVLELALPLLTETKDLVKSGVKGVFGILAAVVVGLILFAATH